MVLLGLPPAAYYSSVRDLFKIGIVDVIPEEDTLEVDGTKVLNGMMLYPRKVIFPKALR